MNRRERRAAAAGARRGNPAGAPVASPAAELLQQVSEAGQRRAHAIVSAGPSPQTVYDAVDDAAAFGETLQERNLTDPSALACKRGCNHCCHVPVGTSAATVLRIAAALRQKLTAAEWESTVARVAALDDRTHGLPWSPSQRPPLPCAFLVEGACSIYPIRPFVCRAWNSVDAEACRQLVHTEAAPLRFDAFRRASFAGVEKGLNGALRARGLDVADLEFTAAIRVALENADACDRWLAGEPVFAGCEAHRVAEPRHRLPVAE